MKKKLLMLLACALLLGACSNTAEKKEEPTKQETSSEQKTEKKEASTEKSRDKTEGKELLVYSGAGLKKPMEEIKTAFEKENGVKINMIYAGSGQLLAQLEKSGKGDLFIVGSKATYEDALKKDLSNKGKPVAHHTPVIVTQKGNPKGIKTLQDLSKPGLKVALGEPEANAIGKTSVQIFKKNKIEGVDKNVVVKAATVNEIYQAIKSGNADAAIVTKDGALNHTEVDVIDIPKNQNIDQIIHLSTLKTSKKTELAQKFQDACLTDSAMMIWAKFGFTPAK